MQQLIDRARHWHWFWLLPSTAGLAFCFVLVCIGNQWTWNLFDEVSWLNWFHDGWTTRSFVEWDWSSIRRFRPLSPFFNFNRFDWLGEDPAILRATRLIELTLLVILFFFVSTRIYRSSALLAAFVLALLLKSPPILENIQVLTLSELPGLILVLLGIYLYSKSRAISYLFLILAGLTKEPFFIFFSLPALQSRNFREAFAAAFLSFSYLTILYLIRKNGYYEFGSYDGALSRVMHDAVRNFYPIAIVILVSIPSLFRHRPSSGDWFVPVCSLAYALVYAASVAFKAPGYTYHYAPSVVFLLLGAASLLGSLEHRNGISLLGVAIAMASAFYFSAKPVKFVQNLYQQHVLRWELIDAIRDFPGTFSSNCEVDRKGLGYAADRRNEGLNCMAPPRDLTQCCRNSSLLGLINQCNEYDVLANEIARRSGFEKLAEGVGWRLYKCPSER